MKRPPRITKYVAKRPMANLSDSAKEKWVRIRLMRMRCAMRDEDEKN
jgi:hypothetical protein